MDRGAFVLSRTALSDTRGSILDAMLGRVPSMRVQRAGVDCPYIALRSAVSISNPGASPLVYVDGARTSDTCVLEMLRSQDTHRVEVYPQGFTLRPGYDRHAHGLILVFMRTN